MRGVGCSFGLGLGKYLVKAGEGGTEGGGKILVQSRGSNKVNNSLVERQKIGCDQVVWAVIWKMKGHQNFEDSRDKMAFITPK